MLMSSRFCKPLILSVFSFVSLVEAQSPARVAPQRDLETYLRQETFLSGSQIITHGLQTSDWDGDGVSDRIVLGSGFSFSPPLPTGQVRVISGRTLQDIRVFDWPWPAMVTASPITDLDGDGHEDILIGSTQAGLVEARSGRTGQVIGSVTHSGTLFDFFSASLAGLDDIDGDGTPDFAVGAPAFGPIAEGKVDFISGRTFQVIRTLTGAAQFDGFGIRLQALGDIDGDRVADLAIFANWEPTGTGGYLDVVSGRTGGIIHHLTFDPQKMTVADIASLPDVDSDGVPDFAWSIISRSHLNSERGQVELISGQSGQVLRQILGGANAQTAESNFGIHLSVLPDFDGDGVEDLYIASVTKVSVPDSAPGLSKIVSLGRNDDRLLFEAEHSVLRPWVGTEDINGDGRSDLIEVMRHFGPQMETRLLGFDRAQFAFREISARAGFTQRVKLDYGVREAGKLVYLLGSLTDNLGSGHFYLGAARVPLIPDEYTLLCASLPNVYTARLDGQGQGEIRFSVPPDALAGREYTGIQYAPILVDPQSGAIISSRVVEISMQILP